LIEFEILGTPRPQPRPRFRNTSYGVRIYTVQEVLDYKADIASIAKSKIKSPIVGAIKIEVHVYVQRPKSLSKKIVNCTKRPDLDNYVKLVFDALNKVAYNDDGQIIELIATKSYGEPRVIIKITEV